MDDRRRRSYRFVVSAFVALSLVMGPAAANSIAKPQKGPSGRSFYTPPKHLPGKRHGDLVRWRKLRSDAALKSAKKNDLLLYRSVGLDGKPIAVSGALSVPKGKAPKGGWPIVAWDHGTSGIADSCAPTLDRANRPAHGYNAYIYPTLNGWLKNGWAVVRTDYEGLGTPGIHPYLIGKSAGRSTLDIIRASRRLEPSLGKKVAIAGHSQGGHAAIWAAGIAPKWTPALDVVGTVAFAPASHLAEQAPLIRTIPAPGGGLGGIVSMVLRGTDFAYPSLGVPSLLGTQASDLYPQTKSRCLNGLSKSGSFGGVPLNQILRSDADISGLVAKLAKNNPGRFDLEAPLRMEQGDNDTTVFPNYTNDLQQELVAKGSKSTLKTYPGVDHGSVVTGAPLADATKFIKRRFKH